MYLNVLVLVEHSASKNTQAGDDRQTVGNRSQEASS